MALDAGLAFFHGGFHFFGAAPRLVVKIHGIVTVAVSALTRITGLHGLPYILRQPQSFGLELFPGVYGAYEFVVQLIGCTDLASYFRAPALGHVAIRTRYPHSGCVGKVL